MSKAPRLNTLGRRLRDARGGRTQAEIAKLLKVSQPTINDWEQNKKRPRSSRLPKIAQVYAIGLAELMTGRAA